MVGIVGRAHGRGLFGRISLFRTESRTSVRSGHPHHDYRDRRDGSHPPERGIGRERHHPEHRGMFRYDCGRSHIHLARPLYPARQISGNDGELHGSVRRLRVGRSLGHPFPHPFPQVFRERHARQISFSRSHGLHAGIGFRGKRWQPGFTAPRGRSRRRHLRFHHRHRRLVERERHVTLSGMGASVGGQDQTRL